MSVARRAKMRVVDVPGARELLDRVRALPASDPLLERLGDEPGVYLVGGAVRDLLLGGEPRELDLVVEGDAAALTERLCGNPRVHGRFGTATVELGGFRYDIARARRETYAYPGALPEVSPATLADDLRRRDFTVNATAIALGGPDAGALRTAPGALDDLRDMQLRVLHPRSFLDDPTRLLRLVRYASRLRFTIARDTLELARAAVAGEALATVSGPRVGAELRLLSTEPDPIAALSELEALGLDAAIHPDFGAVDPAVADRALHLLPADGRADRLAVAIAARRIPGPELARLLDRLAFEAGDRQAILGAATRADHVARDLLRADSASEVGTVLDGAEPELAALAGALGPAAQARQWLEQLRHVRLAIDGRDLIAAGIEQGPAIGRGLHAALVAKLDGRVSGRDAELAEAVRGAQ